MEIGHVEISELTGYSLAKIRKDVQRGKLADLESLVKYVLTSYVSRGLGCLAGAVDPDGLSPGRAPGGTADSSGGEDAQVGIGAVPEKKPNPSDIEGSDAEGDALPEGSGGPDDGSDDDVRDGYTEFEWTVYSRLTGPPTRMGSKEALKQIHKAREFLGVAHLEVSHMEELGW